MIHSKQNKFDKLDQIGDGESIHTILSYVLGITAIAVMFYLGIRHFQDVDTYGRSWGRYALGHACMGLVGMVGIRLTSKQNGLFPKFRKINIGSSIITMATMLILLTIIQVISAKVVLEVTATEEALYSVFSAVTEELFFRATICYVLVFPIFREDLYSQGNILKGNLKKKGKRNPAVIIVKFSVSVLAGVLFGISHKNYYGTSMIYAVTISGVIMCLWFSFFSASFMGERDKGYDLTGMMLGHFAVNLIVTAKWIITL